MIKVWDYKCERCGVVIERFQDSDYKGSITEECHQPGTEGTCIFERMPASPSFKIDVEAPKYVPKHVQRARAIGHGRSNSKTIGAYDDDDPQTYAGKIMVGPK